jgi:hypothetical protein
MVIIRSDFFFKMGRCVLFDVLCGVRRGIVEIQLYEYYGGEGVTGAKRNDSHA